MNQKPVMHTKPDNHAFITTIEIQMPLANAK